MRWIDRGPEPAEIARYSQEYTQGWVDYYTIRDPDGNPILLEPEDRQWSYHRKTLGEQSSNNCWYCERRCQSAGGLTPTVDHFIPRHFCPTLTYAWSNWVYSCRRCNEDNKIGKWPNSGYVNPCADDPLERPENYFDYNDSIGQFMPKDSLSSVDKTKAQVTIDDLGLKKQDLVNPRFSSVRGFLIDFTEELVGLSSVERQSIIDTFLNFSPQERVDYLVSCAIAKGHSTEFVGAKAIIAEKLLRQGFL